jgi:hypothetical protein
MMKYFAVVLASAAIVHGAPLNGWDQLYYQILADDFTTVLCDSRVSSCSEYSDRVEVNLTNTSADIGVGPGFLSFQVINPSVLKSEAINVLVHAETAVSVDFGWYKYVGGPAGQSFLAEYSAADCSNNTTLSPWVGLYTTSFPSPEAPCGGGRLYVPAVFNQPFRHFVDVRAIGGFFLAGVDECAECGTYQASVQFSNLGRLNGQTIPVELVSVPEPSSFTMFTFVLLCLTGRSWVHRARRTRVTPG